MFDLIIKNALVYDGSGEASFTGGIAVEKGKIAEVFRGACPAEYSAKETVDAKGLSLAPGFIDAHSHCDKAVSLYPERDFVLKQGVTTEIGGNCGNSLAPIPPDLPHDAYTGAIGSTSGDAAPFASFTEAKEYLKTIPMGPNEKWFTGHGALRCTVMGIENRHASDSEIRKMQDILVKSMGEGSLGYSTGLSYVPGIYSDSRELIEIAKCLKPLGGMYATHSRSESAGLFRSVQECIDIGREAGIKVEISHFKVVGKTFWPRCEQALQMVDDAVKAGVKITMDCYPYNAVSTTSLSAIPPQYLDKGPEAFAARLEDPDFVEQIRREIYEIDDPSWDNSALHVGLENFLCVGADRTPQYVGMTQAEAAASMGLDPFHGWIRMIHDNNGYVRDVRFAMKEENIEMIYKRPYTVVGSDGIYVKTRDKLCHPRAIGTFPRYLGHYIRERQILSREEGIRRVSGLTADIFGLKTKGYIRKGRDADLVLFDFDSIIDHASFDAPFRDADGIFRVYMEGRLICQENRMTGTYLGKYL